MGPGWWFGRRVYEEGGQVRKFMHLARVVAPNLTFHMSGGCGFKGRNKSKHNWSTRQTCALFPFCNGQSC